MMGVRVVYIVGNLTPKNQLSKLTLITPILSMDPLTGAAIAVGSIIATKVLEKTGEKVGEKVWQQTGKFIENMEKFYCHSATPHFLLSWWISCYASKFDICFDLFPVPLS